MRCYSCRKYDDCEHPWKCDETMYDCTAYELEQTNEEWLHTLNAEQLAEWLEKINEFVNVCDFIGGCEKCPFECCDDNCNDEHYQARVWLWWLKEQHQCTDDTDR